MPLRWLCRLLCQPPPPQIVWVIGLEDQMSFHFQGTLTMHLTTEQKVKLTVRPKTPGGNPARIDGPVRFTSADEAIVRIEPIDDTSAWAVAVAEGDVRVTATFDADLDEGEVRFLSFDADITVSDAEASSGEVEFGDVAYLVLTPEGESEAHESNSAPEPTETTVEEVPADETVSEVGEGDAPAETEAAPTDAEPTAEGEERSEP